MIYDLKLQIFLTIAKNISIMHQKW
ncbi:hypothetical protein BLA29_012923 [Euroglyphus maynei]|uniref:Uncharacterized protein n=1 Tax=Euroglyphus maynei TaxID=6958 RepID=A0A1Y3AUX1_EURMA|nr:hypothetical protein BLA29_012923 [Euroglyphus maynei]